MAGVMVVVGRAEWIPTGARGHTVQAFLTDERRDIWCDTPGRGGRVLKYEKWSGARQPTRSVPADRHSRERRADTETQCPRSSSSFAKVERRRPARPRRR